MKTRLLLLAAGYYVGTVVLPLAVFFFILANWRP